MKVIFKEHSKADGSFLGEIKLHRPKVLNALDLEMILQIKKQLIKWKNHPNLSAVFLHGEGDKAFCAGGDIKNIYSSILLARKGNKDPGEAVQNFFENEYRLNYLMHTYPRPIITWGHGFVMGGGLGLFLASSHKIMTKGSSLSMPEITIGFFPDVGVSHILSRLPDEIGLYLALTGYRINYHEAKILKLADFYFKNTEKEKILQNLISSSFKNKNETNLLVKSIQSSTTFYNQENRIEKQKSQIACLLKSKKLKNIYKKFYSISKEKDKNWAKNRKTFLQGSPTSAGIICEQLKRAKNSTLKEVFQTDLILALNCARGHDFFEGVRALLVEKNTSPLWKPNSVEACTEEEIKGYFYYDPDWINPLQDL